MMSKPEPPTAFPVTGIPNGVVTVSINCWMCWKLTMSFTGSGAAVSRLQIFSEPVLPSASPTRMCDYYTIIDFDDERDNNNDERQQQR